MAVDRFILHFDDGKPKKKGELPFCPVAKISLGSHSSDKEGHHYLTPDCFSLRELKNNLKDIIGQLEEIGKLAEKKAW